MLRRTAILLLMALSAALAVAQLSWRAASYDFGTIKEADGKVSHSFAFVNDGTDTVEVKRTRSSCGCTTATLERTVIAPGDSGILRVEFNPSYRPGVFKKHVAVYTNKGTSQLEVTGKVQPEGETVGRLFPEKMGVLRLQSLTAVVGDVKQGRRRIASVIAYNGGRDTLRLAPRPSDPRLSAVAEPEAVAPGDLVTLSCTFEAGRHDETGRVDMRIDIADGTRQLGALAATAQIVAANPEKVDYQAAPRLELSADRVDFTPIGGKKMRRSVEIRNTGKSELHITGTGTMDDAVKVVDAPRKLKPGKKGKIAIELDPRQMADPGLLNTSVVVFTNDPLQGTVQIRAVGAAEKQN